MDVLFCVTRYPPAATGGAERQALLQAEELVRRGHRVTVVGAATPGHRSEVRGGVRVVRLRHLRRRPLTRVSYLLRLFCFIAAPWRRFDVVHVHLAYLQGDVAVLGGALRRTPVYVKVASGGRAGELERARRMRHLTRLIGLRRAAVVQALSAEVETELLELGVVSRRIARIPNGIDVRPYAALGTRERAALRKRMGLPADRLLLLFMGRFATGKGIADLIQAWPEVAGREGACLVVVGTADTVDAVPNVLGSGDVLVKEWAAQPADYLLAVDVFVHPSRADGMSNAVLEALASGLPVVACEHGGTRDYLQNGRETLFARPADPESLAAALTRVVSDASLREALASRARSTAEQYTITRIVDSIEVEYCKILTSSNKEKRRSP